MEEGLGKGVGSRLPKACLAANKPKDWETREMGAQSNQSSHEAVKEETQGRSTNLSFRKQLPCRKSELRDVCPQACLWEEVRVFLNVLGLFLFI